MQLYRLSGLGPKSQEHLFLPPLWSSLPCSVFGSERGKVPQLSDALGRSAKVSGVTITLLCLPACPEPYDKEA